MASDGSTSASELEDSARILRWGRQEREGLDGDFGSLTLAGAITDDDLHTQIV